MMEQRELQVKRVNIKDFFFHLLERLPIIVVIMVVGSLIGGLYNYSTDYYEAIEVTENDTVNTVAEKIGLSDAQCAQVKSAKEAYNSYRYYLDYTKESILYGLSNADQHVLEYRVVLAKQEDRNTCATSFVSAINNASYGNSEINTLKDTIDSKYLKEVIVSTKTSDGLFEVRIQGKTKEQRAEFTDFVKAYIDILFNQWKQKIGDFTLELVNEYDGSGDYSKISTNKKTIQESMTAANNTYSSSVKSLSNKQKQLLQYMIDGKTDSELIDHGYLKKGLIYGLIVGFAGAVLCIFIVYACSSTIKTVEEISDVYGYSVIEDYSSARKRRGWNKMINQIRYRKKVNSLLLYQSILTNIVMFNKKSQTNQVYIVSSREFDKDSKLLLSKLKNDLREREIQLVCIENALVNIKECEQLITNSPILLCEKIKKSSHREIGQFYEFCERQKIDIAGVITV